MKIILIVAIFILVGCATPSGVIQLQTTRTFTQPYDRVWGAVVASVSGNYPLQVIEKASGILETQMVTLPTLAEYANEPSVFLSCWGSSRGRLAFYVQSVDQTNTTVRVTGHFEGFEYNTTKTWYVWPSRGVLENNILNAVATNL
jgi:hypothetical protein